MVWEIRRVAGAAEPAKNGVFSSGNGMLPPKVLHLVSQNGNYDKGLVFLGTSPEGFLAGNQFVILSKACEYAIRTVLLLATMDRTHFVPVRHLADKLDISAHFLSKICRDLTRHGLLVSQKGPNGGVALAKPPEKIRLIHVVEAIDGLDAFRRCVLGLEPCGDEFPCPVHASWVKIKEQFHELLTRENIQTFAEELAAGVTTLRIDRS